MASMSNNTIDPIVLSVNTVLLEFCEYQTYANFARVDQFTTIKTTPKVLHTIPQ